MARPAPIADALSAPYWDSVAQGRFTLPQAAHRGSVYSFSIVHRAPSAAFAGDVPYVVAIVATDDCPHQKSPVVGVRPDAVRIGMRVRVRVEAQGDAPMLPLFEPDGAAAVTARSTSS